MEHMMTTPAMAKILGADALSAERPIPGTVAIEGREFMYVADPGREPFAELFKRLVRQVDPPRMKKGGALIEGCAVEVPGGQRFQAVSYKGDLEGWRAQLSEGARALDLVTARVSGDSLTADDGRSYALANCTVRFD
jgi:hypothetical protein